MLQELSVTIQGLPRDGVYVESMQGREALSEVYAFVVDIVSRRPVEVENLLGKTARIELTVVQEEMVVNGIVTEAMELPS